VLILVGVVVLLCIALVVLPDREWRNPPLYPGAQEVRSQDFGEWGQRQPDDFNMYIIKVLTYTVTAPPAQVESFYADRLSTMGFEPTTWGRLTGRPARLKFSRSNGRPPSVYFLDVAAVPIDGNRTEVEIGVSMFPGY
jgi:hypothetical protein